MNYTERNVGRCLTERKIKNFDEVIKGYMWFAVTDQWHPLQHVNDLPDSGYMSPTLPKIHDGQILYGVNLGECFWLAEIIDSSD